MPVAGSSSIPLSLVGLEFEPSVEMPTIGMVACKGWHSVGTPMAGVVAMSRAGEIRRELHGFWMESAFGWRVHGFSIESARGMRARELTDFVRSEARGARS